MSNSLYEIMMRHRNPQVAVAADVARTAILETESSPAVTVYTRKAADVAVVAEQQNEEEYTEIQALLNDSFADEPVSAVAEAAESVAAEVAAETAPVQAAEEEVYTLMGEQSENYDEILDLLGFADLEDFDGQAIAVITESAEDQMQAAAAEQAPMVQVNITPVEMEPAQTVAAEPVKSAAVEAVAVSSVQEPDFSSSNSLAQMMMRRREADSAPAAKPKAAEQDPLYGLSMEDCAQGHQEWSQRLTDVLRGRAEMEDAGDEHSCPLGRWLDGEGRALNRYREFDLLRQAHDRFHECAASIIEQHRKGYLVEAIRMLRSDLPQLADAIGEHAFALQKTVRGF
ncbi:hypothetical protein L1281_001999 [Neisseria sp. HSC-16F19]|nr:CZB domain-containing protein [Neisseria sp. HSC-16F19]MCP2041401.1 hypothetical protein [Neisseria sp. HSC-16F19]